LPRIFYLHHAIIYARGISLLLYIISVIHRDIQPANIIVSGGVGAMMDDDLWYSDELDVDGKVSDMARRTRITLVDFGFARALGPRDIDEDIGLRKIADERRGRSPSSTTTATAEAEAGDRGECVFVVGHPSCCSIDRALEDATTSHGGGGGAKGGGRSSSGNADDSISRRSVLDLSEFLCSIRSRPFTPPRGPFFLPLSLVRN
jgi:serine/threonine protein kinase